MVTTVAVVVRGLAGVRREGEVRGSMSDKIRAVILFCCLGLFVVACSNSSPSGQHTDASSSGDHSAAPTLNVAAAERGLDRVITADPVDRGSYRLLTSCPLGSPSALIGAAGLSARFAPPYTASTPNPSGPSGTDLGTNLRFAVEYDDQVVADLPSPRVSCTAQSFTGSSGTELAIAAYRRVSAQQFTDFITRTGVAAPTPLDGGQLVAGCHVQGNKVRSAFFETGCFTAWRPSTEPFVVAMGCIDNGSGASPSTKDTAGTECRRWFSHTLPTIISTLAATGNKPSTSPPSRANTMSASAAPSTNAATPKPLPSAAGYQRYHGSQLGLSVEVPASLRPSAPPPTANFDGASFTSADGTIRVIVYGQRNVAHYTPTSALTASIDDERRTGGTIIYSAAAGDSFSCSGYTGDGQIFYSHGVVGARYLYILDWLYPKADKSALDTAVQHSVATFEPGPL